MQELNEDLRLKSRKRLIRDAALAFLLVILLLTFFSKTINDYLLPEVECVRASGGSLVTDIRTNGEVKISDAAKIISQGEWKILEVDVSEGDEVAKGTVLAGVDIEDSLLELKRMEYDLLALTDGLKEYKLTYKGIDLEAYENDVTEASNTIEEKKTALDIITALFDEDIRNHIADATAKLETVKSNFLDKFDLYNEMKEKAPEQKDLYERTVKEMEDQIGVKKSEYYLFQDNLPYDPPQALVLQLKTIQLQLNGLINDLQEYKDNYEEIDLKKYYDDMLQAEHDYLAQKEDFNNTLETYGVDTEARLRLNDAIANLDDATLDLEKKKKILDQKKTEDAADKSIYNLTVNQKTVEIDLKNAEIEAFKKDLPEDGLILAPVDCVIKKVPIEKGQTLASQQTMFEFANKDSAFSVEWKLNSAESKALSIGDEVNLKLSDQNEINLTSKITDKEYSAQEGLFVFTCGIDTQGVPADGIQEGLKVEIQSTKMSNAYQYIVPNSSVTKSGGRDCIYVLREREGALGKENYADIVYVTVIDSDDFNTAISAPITNEDNIVTLSTKPLLDKTQVKLR